MRCTVKYGVGLLSDLYHPTCCQLTVCVRICCVLCAHAAFARLSKVCFKFSLPAIPPGKIFLSACLVPHSFIPAISIAPLQVLYYSEALPTTARILYRSFTLKRTGNCR